MSAPGRFAPAALGFPVGLVSPQLGVVGCAFPRSCPTSRGCVSPRSPPPMGEPPSTSSPRVGRRPALVPAAVAPGPPSLRPHDCRRALERHDDPAPRRAPAGRPGARGDGRCAPGGRPRAAGRPDDAPRPYSRRAAAFQRAAQRRGRGRVRLAPRPAFRHQHRRLGAPPAPLLRQRLLCNP
jgi:hypothetical protein